MGIMSRRRGGGRPARQRAASMQAHPMQASPPFSRAQGHPSFPPEHNHTGALEEARKSENVSSRATTIDQKIQKRLGTRQEFAMPQVAAAGKRKQGGSLTWDDDEDEDEDDEMEEDDDEEEDSEDEPLPGGCMHVPCAHACIGFRLSCTTAAVLPNTRLHFPCFLS
jgi:hypothetical protein